MKLVAERRSGYSKGYKRRVGGQREKACAGPKERRCRPCVARADKAKKTIGARAREAGPDECGAARQGWSAVSTGPEATKVGHPRASALALESLAGMMSG